MNEINIHIDFVLPLVLTVIFIILRGLNIINWAWYWLISPIWILFIIIGIMFIILKLMGWLR